MKCEYQFTTSREGAYVNDVRRTLYSIQKITMSPLERSVDERERTMEEERGRHGSKRVVARRHRSDYREDGVVLEAQRIARARALKDP